MTETNQRMENYHAKFWKVDEQIGGRGLIRLSQWKF